MIKRMFDFTAATVGLMLLAPLMVVFAVAIRLDSPGPALFRQTRVGLAGRPFTILKFRTMREDPGATHIAPITVSGNPRITRVGKFLRRTKLDELPQLLNVLRGEMSLVGPRPEVPRYVAHYPADARREIFAVRPGITDEASIEFRRESELLADSADPQRTYVEVILPRKIELYRSYVRNQSLAGDVAIVLRTLARIVTGQ